MTPFRSRYVTVALAVIGELPAVVENEDAASIVLSFAVQVPKGIERALDRPVRIECVSPRGIQRVTGTATWDAARPEELRILRGEDAVIQRRETVRVDAVVAARVTAMNGVTAAAETTTVNLSCTGVLLRDSLELAIGAQVQVHLTLGDSGPPVTITGHVVREDGQKHKGVHIDEISRADQVRLTRLITDRQRAELRMAKGG